MIAAGLRSLGLRLACGRLAVRLAVVAGSGGRGHRASSSLNRLDTVRSAKVATMMVPITMITPCAEASP